MHSIHRWIFWLFAIIYSCGLQAQPAVDALIPELLPVAAKARESVLNHPTLAALEIEHTIREAVKKARSVMKGPQDAAAARENLAPLEQSIGPLREIPFIQLQFLLGALSGIEQKTEEQEYHRAFASALFISINRSGKGTSPETAYRVVMLAEEYDWFWFMQQRLKKKSRVSKDINGKKFDIWTAVTASGEERKIYFDVSGMQTSLARVLKARAETQQGAN